MEVAFVALQVLFVAGFGVFLVCVVLALNKMEERGNEQDPRSLDGDDG
jgi:hypothetical protein